MHSNGARTPRVQIHDNLALGALPVRRPKRSADRRPLNIGLLVLAVSSWVYAIAAGGLQLA